MPVEVGDLARLAYVQEVTFGTTPATPVGLDVRQTGFDLTADRNYIDNPEMRPDGMTASGRGGALRGKGYVDGKLSYGTYDDFLAAALGNFAWTSNVVKHRALFSETAATIQIASAGKTFTRPAGSFVTDGFAVGDHIITSGFTNAGNNGTFVISAISALVITCSTATGLVDEGPSAGGHIALNTRPSFTMEKRHLTNGLFFPFLGCVVDGFEMSGKVNDAIDIKFNLVAKACSNESYTTIYSSITAPNTNPLITAWDGSIKKGGASLANVVGWTLKTSRNLDNAEVVGNSSLYDIQPKSLKVEGTMELYFDSFALYTDMRAENDLVFQLNLGPGGTKSYTVDLTLVRIKNWKSVPKDGLMTATVEWESFAPTSGTNTSIMFTRLP